MSNEQWQDLAFVQLPVDPVETVPSYVSMQAALYKLNSVHSDAEVGAFWFPRLAQ